MPCRFRDTWIHSISSDIKPLQLPQYLIDRAQLQRTTLYGLPFWTQLSAEERLVSLGRCDPLIYRRPSISDKVIFGPIMTMGPAWQDFYGHFLYTLSGSDTLWILRRSALAPHSLFFDVLNFNFVSNVLISGMSVWDTWIYSISSDIKSLQFRSVGFSSLINHHRNTFLCVVVRYLWIERS